MSERDKIRVVITDDHEMIRKGIAAYLRVTHDIELVGEASDGYEALRLCDELKPDVILMDLVMPHLGGIDATKQIKDRFPATRVIALSSFQEREMVQEALKEGAISYLLKNVSGDDLVNAIRGAFSGRPTISPEITKEFIMSSREPQVGDDLTEREREVLILMTEGMSNPEIAARLVISRSTARAHVSNILSKLGVSKRAEAVSLALRKKLVK
jgi:NarL family two-component system response regulator LiaR